MSEVLVIRSTTPDGASFEFDVDPTWYRTHGPHISVYIFLQTLEIFLSDKGTDPDEYRDMLRAFADSCERRDAQAGQLN